MIAKVVYVDAVFSDHIISAQADFADQILAADAELVNRITSSQAEEYDGDYEVTSFLAEPSLTTSLILPTRQKIMRRDMTIYSVPTSEEYNPQGGVTFTIGS